MHRPPPTLTAMQGCQACGDAEATSSLPTVVELSELPSTRLSQLDKAASQRSKHLETVVLSHESADDFVTRRRKAGREPWEHVVRGIGGARAQGWERFVIHPHSDARLAWDLFCARRRRCPLAMSGGWRSNTLPAPAPGPSRRPCRPPRASRHSARRPKSLHLSGEAMEPRIAPARAATVFLIYNIIAVPFRLCFDTFAECPDGVWVLEAVIDWFFVADVVFNFFTGVFVHGNSGAISTSLRMIASRYACGYLAVDLASSLAGPLDFIISLVVSGCDAGGDGDQADAGSSLDALKLLRVLRLAKLLKLLRLLRLSRLLDTLQDQLPINTVLSRALTMGVFTLYTGHLTGCVWYLVGYRNAARGQPSWLLSADLAVVTSVNATSNTTTTTTAGIYHTYVASLYWAFTTMCASHPPRAWSTSCGHPPCCRLPCCRLPCCRLPCCPPQPCCPPERGG